MKPKFSNLSSIVESEPGRRWQNILDQVDTLRDFLGFHPVVIYEEYILLRSPADILSFGKVLLKCDVFQE